MNISDEQYEDMQRRINELTDVLGFMIHGMNVIIPVAYMEMFKDAYKNQSVAMAVIDIKDMGQCIRVWMQKDE